MMEKRVKEKWLENLGRKMVSEQGLHAVTLIYYYYYYCLLCLRGYLPFLITSHINLKKGESCHKTHIISLQ